MPRTKPSPNSSRVSLLTTIVILLLIAWTGMAVIMIYRANLTRNETMDTMQRAFNNKTLDLDERIRDLERKVASTHPTVNAGANIFSVDKVKVGDTVAGMKVLEIGKMNQQEPLSEINASVSFDGTMTVSGEYEYYDSPEAGSIKGQLCLKNMTTDSLNKIPVLSSEKLDGDFRICFTNVVQAKALLGTTKAKTGKVTVEIGKYTSRRYTTELWSWDTATLVHIISK